MDVKKTDNEAFADAIHLAQHVVYMQLAERLAGREDLPSDVRDELYTALRADVLFTDVAARAKIDAHFGNTFDHKTWLAVIYSAFADGTEGNLKAVADIIEGLNRREA